MPASPAQEKENASIKASRSEWLPGKRKSVGIIEMLALINKSGRKANGEKRGYVVQGGQSGVNPGVVGRPQLIQFWV